MFKSNKVTKTVPEQPKVPVSVKPVYTKPAKSEPMVITKIVTTKTKQKGLVKPTVKDDGPPWDDGVKMDKTKVKKYNVTVLKKSFKKIKAKPVVKNSDKKSKMPTRDEIAGLFMPNQSIGNKPEIVRLSKDTKVDGVDLKKGQKVMMIPSGNGGVDISRSSTQSEDVIAATKSEKSHFASPGHPVTSNGPKNTSGGKISLSVVAAGLQRLSGHNQNQNFPIFKTR